MSPEPVISLREVARRLPRVLKLPGKIATGRLLGLLKTGHLDAGFRYPGRTERWIPISTKFWASIGTDKIRSLNYEAGNKRRPGTFKVRISDFADELIQAVSQELQRDQAHNDNDMSISALLNEFQSAISASSDRYEVVVREQDWVRYLQQHNLEEPVPLTKVRGGRYEKTSWRKLSVIIGAYLIKHYATTNEEMKTEEAARNIRNIAERDGLPDLPEWPTIKDVLSEIRSTSETLSIK
jgi:hypothetical protein